MSIRDLPQSPHAQGPAPPPAPEAADDSADYNADYWAERFAEERRSRVGRIQDRAAQDGRPQDHGPDHARGYRVRSEDVWRAARASYAAGRSAEDVCAQFNLGLSAFRQRARREGWRRSDVEAEPPEPLGFPPEPEAAAPTPELVDLAWRSAAQAIRRGRAYEARAWMRLWNELKAVVRAEAGAVRLAALQAARAARDAEEEAGLHSLHPESGVQSEAAEPVTSPFGDAPLADSADARATAKALRDVHDVLAMAARRRPP
jgi:hypothetical protein